MIAWKETRSGERDGEKIEVTWFVFVAMMVDIQEK